MREYKAEHIIVFSKSAKPRKEQITEFPVQTWAGNFYCR